MKFGVHKELIYLLVSYMELSLYSKHEQPGKRSGKEQTLYEQGASKLYHK